MLLEVGDNKTYATIGTAISAAPDGGTVRANPKAATANVYPEAVTVNNKRITLIGSLVDTLKPRIQITGAGAGAAPAVLVTGTGGITLVNFEISNAGSTATYAVEGNVAEDWFHRLLITGGAGKCLQGQFMTNLILANGVAGLDPSCQGQVVVIHCTAVNHTDYGFKGIASISEFQACLAYNCNGLGFQTGFYSYCGWNAADDYTPPGPLPRPGMALADIAFVNYAGGDYRLLQTTKAWRNGCSPIDCDFLGNRRARLKGIDPLIVAGAHDPWPERPAYFTGVSSIRRT